MNYHGVARFQEGMTPIAEWEELTGRNMEEAERERTASCKIRLLIPELLKSLGKIYFYFKKMTVSHKGIFLFLCRFIVFSMQVEGTGGQC